MLSIAHGAECMETRCAMPGGVIFEFKCPKGHVTERRFPPGTKYDDHPHIICMKCPQGVIERAYLIFACPEREKKSDATGKA